MESESQDAVGLQEGDAKLRLFQFNTLAKHLAETIQFPYAIDVEKERGAAHASLYESWDRFGVTEDHWLHAALSKQGTPSDYLLCQSECGTFCVEQSAGKYIYSWNERFPQLIAQIQKHDPDLIFLQELEKETVPDFGEALGAAITMLKGYSIGECVLPEGGPEQKYVGVYAPRSDKPMSDGIALLWKTSKLVAEPGKGVQVLRYSDRQKLALLMPLGIQDQGLQILATTTHLHWNPVPRAGKATLQEIEAGELIKHLDDLGRPSFVLLGGDLNCGEQNAAYKSFSDAGFENIDGRVPEGYRKAFSMHVPRAPVPKLTDARHCFESEVVKDNPCLSDYILIRDSPVALKDVTVLDTGRWGFVPGETNGLPHKSWSASDHFPIAYEITLGRL